ncbi:MAG TPA: Hsp70 family protein [Chloroflexota bacterium]|nr:Hsp70 family protein [Chloroflexota bacterium]
MMVGMDFGTTNSGMAVYDGRTVHVLPLDPANANPKVLRTAVYATNEQSLYVGRAAVDTYFAQNTGRSVKTKKVWVGEIEIRGADMFYVTDAYVYVDVLAPGRLFLSIKTGLRDPDYPGSIVGQQFYSLENLIALYLNITKTRAEKLLGRELKQVVLGRPVRFAHEPEKDKLAQARLLQAAIKAGYETVYFQYEPIAAAYSYATENAQPQNVLVFDFGGGTLDLTVMHLGKKGHQVLATGGIPVAGDVFDQKLVRAKLPPHFGEGSYFGPRDKKLKVPPWIFDTFSNWQTILELQTAQNRRMLEDIAHSAQRRHQIESLISLVSSNYGQQMFDIVERAKRELSDKRGAPIHLEGPGFKVIEFVTRGEFERIIQQEILAIDRHIEETVAASGLEAAAIDAVIRTGGSSQIPVFDQMLRRKFGDEKVRVIDTFSSVTAGLGVMGWGIARDEVEARPYTADDVAHMPESGSSRPQISPVNLDLLRRRIQIQEGVIEDVTAAADRALVFVGEGQQITAVPYSPPHPLTPSPDHPVHVALAAALDEPLLIITSHYRFLLLTARQLLERQSVNVRMRDVYMLGQREYLCSLSRWNEVKQHDKLLIVTSLGLARPYPLRVMQENIEAPVPLMFDNQLLGVPVLAAGAEMEDELTLITETGRATRYPVKSLRGSGTQVIRADRDNRVVGAALAQPGDELLLVTADGYGRRLLPRWIELPEKENSPGKVQVARRSPVVGLAQASAWAVTNQCIVEIDASMAPLEDSTKTARLLKLQDGEQVVALLGE